MPLPILNIPLFPDVPNLPGVPPLLRSALVQVTNVANALVADVALILPALSIKRWGVFTQFGVPVVVGDAVKGLEFSQEYRVSDYPQEAGAFQSYNKVQTPFEPRVAFIKSGGDAERSLFLASIAALLSTTDLYAVVTPTAIYPSVTLTRYDYQRTTQAGANLLTVNIWMRQVRVTGATVFTQTRAPNGALSQSTGPVQPAAVTDPLAQAILSVGGAR